MYQEEINGIKQLTEETSQTLRIIKFTELLENIKSLEDRQASPDFWNNHEAAKKLSIELNNLKDIIAPWQQVLQKIEDLSVLTHLAEEEQDQSFSAEITAGIQALRKRIDELELLRYFSRETDPNNAFVTIHPGAGGTESCDWAMMLYRMYIRWAEERGFTAETLDFQPGDEAGLKSATLLITGKYAYGYLKAESGVHRLVRISPFDANKRRHTSFCSVYTSPEIDDTIEVDINPADLRVDTYRAGGAGGQHVNKTESAIRITHNPTGIVVACQIERSQHQNRDRAMKMLRARLYEYYLEEQEKKKQENAAEKKKIEWGSQIRSYVFQPYTLVKDHRTNTEIGNIQSVMDGGIDEFIMAYLKQYS